MSYFASFRSFAISTRMTLFSTSSSVVLVVMARVLQLVPTGIVLLNHIVRCMQVSERNISSVEEDFVWTMCHIKLSWSRLVFFLVTATCSGCLGLPREVRKHQLWKLARLQTGILLFQCIRLSFNTDCACWLFDRLLIVVFALRKHIAIFWINVICTWRRLMTPPSKPGSRLANLARGRRDNRRG